MPAAKPTLPPRGRLILEIASAGFFIETLETRKSRPSYFHMSPFLGDHASTGRVF